MLEKFYRDVLPDSGYYCLFDVGSKRHLWADSIDMLTRLTESRIDSQGIYFGTASFASPDKRTQVNVHSITALRLDVDAGEVKHAANKSNTYPTRQDAIRACARLFKATVMPSYLIGSGEGLHVYFILNEPVEPKHWESLSRRLQLLCKQYDLRVDPTTTTDLARVLRPPGTLHPNGERVGIIYEGEKISLETLESFLPPLDDLPEPPAYLLGNRMTEADIVHAEWQSSALAVAGECAALRHVAEVKGDVSEPYWYSMIGLVKHCVEGDDLIHEWSDGYEGYDPDEVDKKIVQWDRGPATCENFERWNSDACAACPHKGRIKSPIVLGRIKTESAGPSPPAGKERYGGKGLSGPWDRSLPRDFYVQEDGMYGPLKQEEDEYKDGQFAFRPFWFGPSADAVGDDDTAQVVVYLKTKDGFEEFTIPQSVFATPAKLIERLAGLGIHKTNKKGSQGAMYMYATEALNIVYGLHTRPKISGHLGMHILKSGQLVAVQGNHTIYPDGTVNKPVLSSALEQQARQHTFPLPPNLTGEWNIQDWQTYITPAARRHVEFLGRHYGRPEYSRFQLVILMALCSPLMPFVTGEYRQRGPLPKMSSITVSLYSKGTGRGKTTSVQTALAAFGSPDAMTVGAGTIDATDLGRMARLPLLGSMPLLMDEMSDNPQTVARTVSAVANGSGRAAMRIDGKLRESGAWSLVNIISTNHTQRELIQQHQNEGNALQYRLLEINMDGLRPFSQEEMEVFNAEWGVIRAECAGALGAELHLAMCALGVEKVNDLVAACVARAAKLLKCDQAARFQYRALGAMLAAAALLKSKGLLPFDVALAADEFKKSFDEGEVFSRISQSSNAPHIRIGTILQEVFRHTAITDKMTDRRRDRAAIDGLINERSFQAPVRARHVLSERRTYLDVNFFRTWCTQNKISHAGLKKELIDLGVFIPLDQAKAFGVIESRVNLLRGTELDTGNYTTSYTIDIERLESLDPEFRLTA